MGSKRNRYKGRYSRWYKKQDKGPSNYKLMYFRVLRKVFWIKVIMFAFSGFEFQLA